MSRPQEADAHLRDVIAYHGRRCEIACAVRQLGVVMDSEAMVWQGTEHAEYHSAQAFAAIQTGGNVS